MTEDFDANAYVDMMATVMGIEIDPAWRPTVVANMINTQKIAAHLLDFPLDVHVEPAFRFEA
ncbi:DUF4089 domain-containing protein [Methylobrevis pamukkalensis]|uniref:DUF4089 domain-containing protein n=1 Tax=Methylobrevis pamukkalensis TaxID=1439726 RepID=A0A1E3H0X3_9HYPH|nr:DUF4089 domain-containing protein [Methylobrevis pamukkalensis]ODN69950.1 hypothetical protein A6302_02723 [Methylobrevis pamukkalensis]